MSNGKGYYYHHNNGERVDITWGDKISEALKERHKNIKFKKKCKRCGASFEASRNDAKWCSQKCATRANYRDISGALKKAKIFGANLLMGQGKQDKILNLIESSIDKPCRYCRKILTLENMSIDHIVAYGEAGMRYEKTERAKAYRRHMDRIENLQIICKICNANKGDFDHDEFAALLGMDDKHPGMVRKIKRRLSQSRMGWGAARKGRKS